MNLERLTDAESETISLTEVRKQIRITSTASDDDFRQFIAAIRHQTEKFIGKTLVKTTWQLKLDCFLPIIDLPMGPISAISSIDYVDDDGADQSFTDFQFDKSGRLAPAYNFSWPSTRPQFDAVTISYVAGKANAGLVEPDIKRAMLLMIGAADVGREDFVIGAGVLVFELPGGAKSILAPHKRWRF